MIRSLIFIFVFFVSCSPLKKYGDSGEKWEQEIKKLELLDQKENYSDNAILFIGSSSIRLWKSIKQDLDPYEPIKRGYGGARYSDLIHFTERLVSPHKVKAVGIFVANDITGGMNDLSPKEVLDLAKFIVKKIRKSHKNKPIFFIETTPTSKRWKVWDKISKANDLIKDFSSNNRNIFYIDTRSFYFISNGIPNDDFFIRDKLHLNSKGYKLWAKILKESFDKNLN
ncbi:MAG: GDSL-type esterase/lipase family protein [Flavobacteriaceae bacterium]